MGSSKPSATAIGMSMTMLSHRICSGSSGIPPAMAKMPAPMKIAMYATSVDIWNRRYLSRLSYSARPYSTAPTIVAKLSSVRIITAASLETSVPVMPIATPMFAALSAGASLTPSPVIATIWPLCWSSRTRRTLSSGATRAITPISARLRDQLVVAHRRELGPGDGPALDPELPRRSHRRSSRGRR